MWTKPLRTWIVCFVWVVIQNAGEVRAGIDIESLKRNIAAGEALLKSESYLLSYCQRLADPQFFFHRGRYQRFLRDKTTDPVVSFATLDAYLKGRVAARRITQERADQEMAVAKRRRNEVANACNVAYNKTVLANAMRPPPGLSGQAKLTWNQDADYNHVIHSDGTITGNAGGWQFTGTGTASWSAAIRPAVTCSGSSSGLGVPGRDNGTLRCRAEWTEGGRRIVRECNGPGSGRAYGYNATKAWFVALPKKCVGTITGADGRPVPREFGYMLFPVLSQDSPFNF